MSVTPLSCPACEARVGSFDQYCGVCGTVLARLRWSTPGDETWHSGDGHVVVPAGARSVDVRFRNEGVVAAALVLRAEEIALLPDWVDREKLHEQTLILQPAAEPTVLEVPLVAARLAPLFEAPESSDADEPQREARLPFLTNLSELRDGRWTSRPFELTLLAARRPWISPPCSFYRFLPVERLAAAGIEHRVELHNETLEALDVFDVLVTDGPEPGPAGYVQLPAGAVVATGLSSRQRIAAGASWNDVRRLSLAVPPREALGWFSTVVEYLAEGVDSRDPHRIACRIQGQVGRGPTIAVEGPATLLISLDEIEKEHAFTLRNPGQIPVLVEAIEILQGDEEESAPHRDWLALGGLAAGEVLAPNEARTLAVRLHRSRRSADELELVENRRRIRIRHDGLADGGRRSLELSVFARFGEAREIATGIDFGTTSSVVCVGGDLEGGYALRLERNGGADSSRIRSLMYFDGNARGATADEQFLFGEAAYSSAGIRPENLVRSIKTVVARDPRTEYVFYRRTFGAVEERISKTPQALLDLFIAELRKRAEFGASYLSTDAYDALDLPIGTQIKISPVVFSHPGQIIDDAKQALMTAAHHAGIYESVGEVEEFFEQSCIDEATAAVLAYVAGRLEHPPLLDVPPTDRERVLCFDMGGGTTDLAAVEVLHMASYRSDDRRIVVNLEAKNGAVFGGDDLDKMVAAMILAEVRRQSEERGDTIVLEDLERAIMAHSYSAFRTDFQHRKAAVGELAVTAGDARAEDQMLAIYKLATEILGKAEETKRRFSAEQESETIVLSGSGWPRRVADAQAAAQNYEVQLRRADFEGKVREQALERLELLDRVVAGAQWKWPSVTTLLFTGQSVRVPIIRQVVATHVAARRGRKASPLLRIDPDQGRFDPKNCVARGAAIWGANRRLGSWLEIHDRARDRLTFNVERRYGPGFRTVQGLQIGQPYPAKGTIRLEKGARTLALHRHGNKEPYVRFSFPRLPEAAELTVCVKGPSAYTILVDGREHPGEIRS